MTTSCVAMCAGQLVLLRLLLLGGERAGVAALAGRRADGGQLEERARRATRPRSAARGRTSYAADHRAEPPGGRDRLQPGDAGAEDQDLGRPGRAGRGHQHREVPAVRVRRRSAPPGSRRRSPASSARPSTGPGGSVRGSPSRLIAVTPACGQPGGQPGSVERAEQADNGLPGAQRAERPSSGLATDTKTSAVLTSSRRRGRWRRPARTPRRGTTPPRPRRARRGCRCRARQPGDRLGGQRDPPLTGGGLLQDSDFHRRDLMFPGGVTWKAASQSGDGICRVGRPAISTTCAHDRHSNGVHRPKRPPLWGCRGPAVIMTWVTGSRWEDRAPIDGVRAWRGRL